MSLFRKPIQEDYLPPRAGKAMQDEADELALTQHAVQTLPLPTLDSFLQMPFFLVPTYFSFRAIAI